MDRKHRIIPQGGLTKSHLRVETVTSYGTKYDLIRMDARRCLVYGTDDQAQIEITLESRADATKRPHSKCATMILTPAQARALALAICPELHPMNLPVNEASE